MVPLNEDGLGIGFGRDSIEKITANDARIKELSDQLELESGYVEDSGFKANYPVLLDAVASAQEIEIARLAGIAEVLHHE